MQVSVNAGFKVYTSKFHTVGVIKMKLHVFQNGNTEYLEVLPFLKFIQITVCNHNFGSIRTLRQTLVILHELVGFVDSEKLLKKKKERKKLNSYN